MGQVQMLRPEEHERLCAQYPGTDLFSFCAARGGTFEEHELEIVQSVDENTTLAQCVNLGATLLSPMLPHLARLWTPAGGWDGLIMETQTSARVEIAVFENIPMRKPWAGPDATSFPYVRFFTEGFFFFESDTAQFGFLGAEQIAEFKEE